MSKWSLQVLALKTWVWNEWWVAAPAGHGGVGVGGRDIRPLCGLPSSRGAPWREVESYEISSIQAEPQAHQEAETFSALDPGPLLHGHLGTSFYLEEVSGVGPRPPWNPPPHAVLFLCSYYSCWLGP